MNKRQANKKMMFTTEFEKDWRTWYKYHVPFYVRYFSGKVIRVASRHTYLKVMYESTYFRTRYLQENGDK